MDLLDKLINEINEAISTNTSSKGGFRIINKIKSDNQSGNQPGNQSGNQSGNKSGNQPGNKSGNKSGNQPGNKSGNKSGNQPGNQPGNQSGNQPGNQPGNQSSGQQNGGTISIGPDGQISINGKPTGPKTIDNHDGLQGGNVQDFDDIVRKVYDEVKSRESGDGSTQSGAGKGSTMERVEAFLKPKFNINPILKRLDEFKRLVGIQIVEQRKESYSAAQHNPASQTGDMMRPMKIPGAKAPDVIKESAILIFAVDTSGSITQKDYQFIFGFLRKIEEHFAKPLAIYSNNGKKLGTMSGEVYLIEWDDGVHLPMRKWTQVSRNKVVLHVTKKKEEEAKEQRLKGGGGTDINKLWPALDKMMYREINGKRYFDLDETADYINTTRDIDLDQDKTKQAKGKKFRVPLAKQKNTEMVEVSKERIQQDVTLEPGEPNFLEGRKKVANVPFLLIYTDGYFDTANYTRSKLYADNPGNILYILTSKGGLQNLRPVNVMYHDIHDEGESNLVRISKK